MTKNHDPTTSCSICLSSWRRNRQKKKKNPNWFGHLSGSLTFMVTIMNLHPKQILPGKHNRKKWSKYKQQGRNFPSFSKIKKKKDQAGYFHRAILFFPYAFPNQMPRTLKPVCFHVLYTSASFFFFFYLLMHPLTNHDIYYHFIS